MNNKKSLTYNDKRGTCVYPSIKPVVFFGLYAVASSGYLVNVR